MFSLHDHRSPEFDCAIISSTALLKLRIFATRMIFSAAISLFLCFYNINLLINFVDSYSSILSRENSRIINPSIGIPFFHKKITHLSKSRVSDVEEIIQNIIEKKNTSYSTIGRVTGSDKVVFPELEQAGIDEKALRKSPFGKVLFGILGIETFNILILSKLKSSYYILPHYSEYRYSFPRLQRTELVRYI